MDKFEGTVATGERLALLGALSIGMGCYSTKLYYIPK